MGTLFWYRAARRVVGLSAQPEYPNLEAFLESEAGQPDNGYFLAARIVPPIALLIATAVFVPLGIMVSWLFFFGTAGFSLLGLGAWFLFDFLDRSISKPKKRIRQIATQVWGRYGMGNLFGVDPVVSENVGPVLDEAAGIYLRHSRTAETRKNTVSETYTRAYQALEVAMSRMLELAAAPNARNQELEFESGWAMPLLREMRQMDAALTRYTANGALPVDPLANLREARAELTGLVTAIDELEQHQST